MGRFERIRESIAELIDTSDSDEEPKGFAGDEFPTGTIVGNYLEQNPPREELNEYYALYRDVGLIKSSINNFASEVLEPGWYITADSQDTADELLEFMEHVAITNTERNQNFTELAYKMIIEREVRGTVFVEKYYDDEGRPVGLYPLQNDTITIYTIPGKAMLPPPDADTVEPVDVTIGGETRVPQTEDGKTGAYVQFDDFKPRWNHRTEIVYTSDQIIKWVRDADIGEARGTSRIRSIQERAEGWLQKIQDNDAAIRSKAWPMIIFNMGTEDNPWTRDQVEAFLDDYSEENLEPGMMQAVSGDVSVEEFAGETADIEGALHHDINTMMSGLPGPVYATGGFSQNVAPAVAQAQQRQFIKEVKYTRRRLEEKIEPFLREVAEAYDLDDPDSVEFHIGRPQGDVPPEDVSGSIIRYTSDAGQPGETAGGQDAPNAGAQGGGGGGATNEGGTGAAAPQPGQTNMAGFASGAEPANSSRATSGSEPTGFARNEQGADHTVATAELEADAEELADPRLVSTDEQVDAISAVVSDALLAARDEALDALERQYGDAPIAGSADFARLGRKAVDSTLSTHSIDGAARPPMETAVRSTVDTLNQDNHDPTLNIPFGVRHRQRSRTMAENVEQQARQAMEEMMHDVESVVTTAAQNGEPADAIVDRVQNQFDDAELEQRADIIAHMAVQQAVNSTKLAEYERHDSIAGIKVINSCTDNTTRLCRNLADCAGDDPATAMFDAEESVSGQLQEHAPASTLFEGFTPLPPAPPFHFGCTSEIVPIPARQA